MGSEEEKDEPTPLPDDSMAETIASDTPQAERAEALFAEALGSTPEEGVASLPADGKIGKFEIIEKIGTGGFGDVYRAQQFEPVEREVALKVLKPGMDSREIVGRFESERQALALMEHSNIAKVLDGGETPAGHPYFVMELVRGLPVTAYCDKKNLSIRERLGIFRQICAGVQHAHQKGIIHRDLKPSNILVEESDGKPIPKVIDFGVSKAITGGLSEWTVFTQAGQAIGTPQYMSPEQALTDEGGIDTRSDIFSLGVILYELLTGEPPITGREFQEAGMLAFAEVIQKKTPLRPSSKIGTVADTETVTTAREMDISALRRTLRQDLDWIVMKALEKERNRRYDSATEFSEDIARFLRYQPVLASPPSKWYAFKKFTRRQRGPILAGAAVFGAVVLGAVVSVWQAIRATEESERARMAERQSALQRDAVNAVNIVENNPRRALEIMQRVTDESELLFGELSPPVTNALIQILDSARETSRMKANGAVDADLAERSSVAAVLTGNHCFLFDLKEGKERTRIQVASEGKPLASTVAMFPEADRFFVGYDDGKAKIFSVAKGVVEEEWQVTEGAALVAAEISTDESRILLLSGDAEMSRWDDGGEQLGKTVTLGDSAISEFLACDPRVEVAIATGTFVSEPHFLKIDFAKGGDPVPVRIDTTRPASALAVRADGRRFLTGHQDGTIQFWDRSGNPVGGVILAHRSAVTQVAFVDGTEWVASMAQDGEMIFFGEGGEVMSPPMRGRAGKSVALESFGDGRFLTGVSSGGDVYTWDVLGAQARPGIFTGSAVERVVFPRARPDEMLVSLADGRVQAIDWKQSGKVLREISVGDTGVLQMELNPSETVLAMSLRNRPGIYLMDYPSLENLREIPTGGTWTLCLDIDEENVFAYDSDGTLFRIACKAETVEEIAHLGLSNNPSCELFRLKEPVAGHTHILTGGLNGALFSTDGSNTRLSMHGIYPSGAVETDEGLALAEAGGLRLVIPGASGFDFDRNEPPLVLFSGRTIEQLAFHPSGRTLAFGSDGGLIRILDSSGNSLSPNLRAHRIGLETVAIHPEEPLFVTTGHAGWIRFWGSHPEVWKRILSERLALGVPETTFSIPPIIEKDQAKLSPGEVWEGAVSVPEAGFTLKADDSWEKASVGSVAAINQLLVQSLGDKYKRMRFVSVYFGNEKAKESGFFNSDVVVVVEIPEFSNPLGFADRLASFAKQFNFHLDRSFDKVFQVDRDSMEFEWDSDFSGVHFQCDVEFRGGNRGKAECFWKPTRGSCVAIASLSSYEVVADDPDGTDSNRELQERFLSGVRDQVAGAIIHEDFLPSEGEMAEIRQRVSEGSILFAEGILGGESKEFLDLFDESDRLKHSDRLTSLDLAEKALLLVEAKMKEKKSPAKEVIWRQRRNQCLLRKAFLIRNIGRPEDALALVSQALESSVKMKAEGRFSHTIHRGLLNELYFIYWKSKRIEDAVKVTKEKVELSRQVAERSNKTPNLRNLGEDLLRSVELPLLAKPIKDTDSVLAVIEEAAHLADTVRKDPEFRYRGIELAIGVSRKLIQFHRAQGNPSAVLKVQRALRADLELMASLRPDQPRVQGMIVGALRDQAWLQLQAGEPIGKAVETFRESFRESTRWIERFGISHQLDLYAFKEYTIEEVRFFQGLGEAGEHPLLVDLQGEQIAMIRSWPESVRRDRLIAHRLAELLRIHAEDLAKYNSAPLATTGPLMEESIKVCLPFFEHKEPGIRNRFVVSALRTIGSHGGALKDEPVGTFGDEDKQNEARVEWLGQAVPLFQESGDPFLKSVSRLDLMSRIATAFGWALTDGGKAEEAVAIAEKVVSWRKSLNDLDGGTRKRLFEYAYSFRTLVLIKESAGRPWDQIEPDIAMGQSLFTDWIAKGESKPSDYMKRAMFYQTAAGLFEENKNPEKAIESAKVTISDLREFLKSEPDDVNARVRTAECKNIVARCLVVSDEEAAIGFAREALPIYRQLRKESPELSDRYLGSTKGTIGFLKNRVAKYDPAEAARLEAEMKTLDPSNKDR